MEPPVMMDTVPDYFQFAAQDSGFPAGFPFEDDMMSRGRQDIRSHLDDLAQRHPEFADHLRCPPWGGEMGDARTWGRKRRGSGSGEDDVRSQASGASSSSNEQSQPDGAENQENQEEPGPLRGRPRPGNLPQYGLRNTVDLGQQQHESEQEKQGRGQRSMSAPPDNRTQQPQQPRYVSRVEINPVNPADPTSGGGPVTVTSESHAKPPVAPKQPQQQAQQQSTPTKQAGNVRHIPIFVEGRDEPILPKNVGTEKVEQVFPTREQVFTSQHSPHSFGRPPPFGSHHFYQQPPQPSPAPQAPRGFQQPQSPKVQRQAKPQQPQQQQPPPPQQQQQQPPPPQQQPQPQQQHHQPPPANDPISRVRAVQKDVEELKAKVEQYSGNSRKEKEYIYLDEMLTRNLLKLDDIDTEGKDNVRQARKDVIRSIQKCISVLEEKVPIPDENKEPSTEEVPMETGAEESQTTVTAESEKIEETAPSTENEMEVVQSESATKDAVEERNVNEPVAADAATVVEGQTNENVQSDAVKSKEELKMDVTQSNESKEAVPEESGEVKEQIPMEVEEQKTMPETTQSENPQPENSQKEISQPDASQTETTQPEKSKTESTQPVTKPVKKKVVKKGAKKDSASAEKSDKSACGDSNKVPEPTPVSENKDSSTTSAETSTPQPEAEKSS
ncbi:BAG domain-containing protein Samui isoform X2 [Periplaneta americana]|uniref:BAG domain-containing protein Samui isoform X2 n=1 Tax=Periplaneta americana TaxID=6978 RepID=UPI0037E9B38B